MKISKWMKGFLAFLLSFSVMFTTMIQQSVVMADEGSVDPAEVIDEEAPASTPEAQPTAEAEVTPAASETTVTEAAETTETVETAEPAVQPEEPQAESTPAAEQAAPVQEVTETPAKEQAYVSPTSFDAEKDNIKVHVETAEGAFSESVTLVVSLLEEDSDDYKKVQETMDQNGSSQDGMLALDIRFENSNGQEVEPNGQVSVSVVMKDAANEDIDQSSLQVTHLREEEDGSLTPEKVADNDENTEGYIRTSGNDIEADFKADSFSTYVMAYDNKSTLTINYVDQSGNNIASSETLDGSRDTTYDLSNAKSIDGYQNPTIHVGSYNGTEIDGTVYYRGNNWYYSGNYYQWNYMSSRTIY
ncbi:MucBP domain-containing protein, partial [Lactimicrobium sp.]